MMLCGGLLTSFDVSCIHLFCTSLLYVSFVHLFCMSLLNTLHDVMSVEVGCSGLQCAVVGCSVLQCVAVRCSLLQTYLLHLVEEITMNIE